MTGFLDKIMNMGTAHMQHVEVLRNAVLEPDMQAARDGLARYLQGLSNGALTGFHISAGMLAASESNPQIRQALQWIQANVDGLRAGEFVALTPDALPPHGLSVQRVTTLLETWARMTPEEANAQFMATLQALDAQGREELAGHLDILAMQAQQRLQELRDNESNAWGTSYEDRMAYLSARIGSGERGSQSPAVAQQQTLIEILMQMAEAARQWQAAPAPAAPGRAETHGPDMTGFPVDGSAADQMSFMQTVLEREKARGKIDPARAAALEDFVDQFTADLRKAEARKQRRAADPADRQAMEADLRADMSDLSGMQDQMDRFRGMQRDIRREEELPAGSRAAELRPHLNALADDIARLRIANVVSKRESDANALERLQLALISARARIGELAGSDENVLRYEADTLRPTSQTLRLFHRRGHAMIARPFWSGGDARVDPGSVLFAGPASLRAAVGKACASRRLDLFQPRQPGVDEAAWSWRCMQRAGMAIIDLSEGDPQTYYQLGQAYAVGTELLLAAREDANIPFDVSQFILGYRSAEDFAEQLPAALDSTLYGIQTDGLSALMHTTLQRCRDLAEKAAGLDHASVLLSQLEATVQSPLDFRAALEQFLGVMGNSRLLLVHPRWPANYPAAGERRCFIVMPFSETLADTQAMYRGLDADLSAAGVQVVRGDHAAGQEIVASIWEETARASHVIVDLTGFNLNVCLELGMADAIGRDTLLIGAKETVEKRFAAIAKRRIQQYGGDDAGRKAVRDQALAFAQRPPTLQ